MNGFLNLYKPKGVSSAYVLNAVKRSIRGEVVGHMGTLDPLASGVLPVAIGKSTRLFDYLLDKTKVYVAHFTFGYQTDTLDLEGTVEKMSDFIHTAPDISKFIIGIFGSMDTVTTPHSDGSLATRRYLSGTEYETIVKRRTALLRTTLDDLSETNRLIEKTLEGATYTVVASRDTLDKFGEIERILEI